MALDFQEDDDNKLDFQLDFQADEPESSGALGTLAQTGKNAFGGIDAAGTMLLSVPGVIAGGLAGLGTLAGTGGDIDKAMEVNNKVADKLSVTPFTKAGEEVQGMVGHAAEAFKNEAGTGVERWASNENGAGAPFPVDPNKAHLFSDAVLGTWGAFAPIPGGKAVHKAGAAIEKKLYKRKIDSDVSAVEAKQAEIDAAKQKEVSSAKDIDFQADDVTRQMDLLEPDNQGKAANPYEAQHGYWTVDENGMPIRADLSMEAQNMQAPLQRNLWGDELPARETPRGQAADLPMDRDIMGHERLSQPDVAPEHIGITEAMDNTRRQGEMAESLDEAVAKMDQIKEQVDMLSHDLMSDPALERARMDAEVMTPRSKYTDPSIRTISPGGRQTGAINPNIFKAGYEAAKKVGDYTMKLIGDERFPSILIHDKKGNVIGGLDPSAKWFGNEQHMTADMVHIDPQHRGKGLAQEAYKFLSEQGNDIKRSDVQLDDGKKMWDGFEKRGFAKNGFIPKYQRGAVGNLNPGKKSRTIVDDLKDRFSKEKNMIPDNPDPKQVVADALKEGKDSKQFNYTESGATLASMKRGSAAVEGAARIIQNAEKRSNLEINRNVLPTERALRKLSRPEISALAEIMKKEMLRGKRFDAEALSHLSVRQQEAYAQVRHMFEDTLRIQNEARAAKGQPPITEMEAYLSSRWTGDFRRPVFQAVLDKDGNPKIKPDGSIERKLVWYLAAHTKHGLEKQWKALQKDHPDLTFDPKEDHVVRFYKRETDLQSAYSTLLDILGRDDPAIARIQEAIKQQSVNEAATFLGQEKHFKEKAGIRGFVGDRPGKVGSVDESVAMFQQQIQYAKNAYKWSELQKSAQDLKEIVADKDLVEQQPNNVKYIKEYFKQNVGYGEARVIAHLEDSVRDLGISPTLIDKGVGGMKSTFILQKLAANTGYTIAGLLQTANALPHLAALWGQGYRGNPLRAAAMGIAGGIALSTGHYVNYLGGRSGKGLMGTKEGAFLNKAFKYAEDNGVTSRALYDEAPIETSFSTVGRVANAAGKTMMVPEVFGRSMAYMTFVQYLKDTGKFKNDVALFQKAEELTNAAMVDYRGGERPMMFTKMGTTGNFLNTLQTYPVNWYNQWNYFGREAAKGNIAPIMTAFAVQYAIAGAMGIPGFDDMDKLYQLVRDHVVSDSTYAKMRESDFFSDPKMWMVKNFGQSSVYGALSDKSGWGITSRVAAPGAGQMLQSPVGPITDIGKQAMNLGSAILDPKNTDKWGQVAMSSTPPGLQGLVETAPFMEGTMWDKRGEGERIYGRPGNVEAHEGVVTRTPQEETLRKFGLRSQRETLERELGYRTAVNTKTAETKARSIPNAMYAAAKRGDMNRVKELYDSYVKLTGNEISQEAWNAEVTKNYFTSVERASSAAKSVTAMRDVARMNAILEQVKNEYKQRGTQ